jgi:hypothetical protein
MKNIKSIISLLIIICFTVISVGCNATSSGDSGDSASGDTLSETYSETEQGWTVKYPAGWTTQKVQSNVSISKTENLVVKSATMYGTDTTQTLSEYVDSIIGIPESAVETSITVDGITATKLVYLLGYYIMQVVLVSDSKVYSFTYSCSVDDLSIGEAMLDTFQLL